MGLSDDLIATGNKLLLSNYGRAPDRAGPRGGQPAVGRRGPALPGHDRRDRGLRAGPRRRRAWPRRCTPRPARLHHVSNLYFIEAQIHLAEALARRGFPGRFFFCNSGTEANEAALKIARRYQIVVRGQPDRTDDRRHGGQLPRPHAGRAVGHRAGQVPAELRAAGARAASSSRSATSRRPRAAIDDRTCAVITEPIQAEGGINLPPPGYLQELKRLCADRGALLIFDEVQTGVGRTGTFYAYEKEGVVPDVITLAKGLAGGVPMGAMVASEEVGAGVRAGHPRLDLRGQPAGLRRRRCTCRRRSTIGSCWPAARSWARTSARRCCGWPSGGGPRTKGARGRGPAAGAGDGRGRHPGGGQGPGQGAAGVRRPAATWCASRPR